MTVVVGVDGSGRTHRLRQLAAAAATSWWLAGPPTAEQLATARADRSVLVVDDAHRLDTATLRALVAAGRNGLSMLVARRPTIDRPELAELDEVASAVSGVELLGPLDLNQVAALLATVTGRPSSPDTTAAVLDASAGLAAVAAALASTPPGTPSPALIARVQRRFAVLDAPTVALARVLALRLDLRDPVLAAAAGIATDDLAAALRSLRDEGLLVPNDERMIPAVADAVLAELSPAERRRLHDAVAHALIATNADPVAAATQLRAARVHTASAATAYQQAGERLRFTDPAAALGWFDDAADAGADPATTSAGRAEAAALLGLPIDDTHPADLAADQAQRLALVTGAVAAHQGRAARAADILLAADHPGPLLAVSALIGTGRLAQALAGGSSAPTALHRLAEATLAATDPVTALPLLIEAAEAIERSTLTTVLPDTPHALGAIIATACGDLASAERLLDRAMATGIGGPVAAERHHLLLAWARLRAGRYDTALDVLRRGTGSGLAGREALLRAALAAGVARRRGDIAGLRAAWTDAEPTLARRTVDLWHLEAVEELAVAAARVRQHRRAEPVIALLEGIVEDLGNPAAWVTALGWLRVQVAVADDDADAARAQASRLAGVSGGGDRATALRVAAARWAEVLGGVVESDAVLAATEDLDAAQLPWEASRLAGQAAIRTADPAAARRLLERARELSEQDEPVAAAAVDARSGSTSGLSEREMAVARLVLAGSTHREIGAQLYIAPKTVEHHVARIRTKLGVSTRAELLARLREIVGD